MIFLYYPKCSTCKRVKQELEGNHISFTERDIVLERPTEDELLVWANEEKVNKFFNTSGLVYKSLGLKDKMKTLSYAEKIHYLASDGMLVKRPILITADAVYVGPKEIQEYIERK